MYTKNEPNIYLNKTMDLDEAITVTPLDINGRRWYLMVGWLSNSFKLNLYSQDDLWKGKFSYNRLVTFSKSLNISENEYFTSVKRCLSQHRKDYSYELKGGFFYWKQKVPKELRQNNPDRLIIQGFLPVELDSSPKYTRPDLMEILLAINKQLKYKVKDLKAQYETVKTDYEKCLKDTQDFFNLKIEMEKALCDTFLKTIHVQKSAFGSPSPPNSVCADTKLFIGRLSTICPDRKIEN